jgi:hypothetical protein
MHSFAIRNLSTLHEETKCPYKTLALAVIERAQWDIQGRLETGYEHKGGRVSFDWRESIKWVFSDNTDPGTVRFWFDVAGLGESMLVKYRNLITQDMNNRKQLAEQRNKQRRGIR